MWGTLATANTYRYSSKEIDPQSGIYYYGYRYYEPNLQRWLNRDPIGEWGGINLYRYVRNNPINYRDPFGLQPVESDPFNGWGPPNNSTPTPNTFGGMGDASDIANYEPGHFELPETHEPVFGGHSCPNNNQKADPNYHSVMLAYNPDTGMAIMYGWETTPPVPPLAIYNGNFSPNSTINQNAPPTTVSPP